MSMSVDKFHAAVEPDRPTPAPRFLPLETISVRLSLPDGSDRGRIFGIISNMSVTGCCLIANRSVPIGTTVELTIRSPRRKNILKLTVHTIWCAERFEPVKEIVGYLTGVSFQAEDSGRITELLMGGLFQSIP